MRWLEQGDDDVTSGTSISAGRRDGKRGDAMSATVRVNRHGFLTLRIRWRGRDAYVGTKLKDDGVDGRNRARLTAKATLIAEDLRDEVPIHTVLLKHLGACPVRLLPTSERAGGLSKAPTVREYYEAWIQRQQPPDVRVSTAKRHETYFKAVILPRWGDVPLDHVTVSGLREFRRQLCERTVRADRSASRRYGT